MLLFVEIGLTIWAWCRGWKGWALLPLPIGCIAQFSTGVIVAMATYPGPPVWNRGLSLWLDMLDALIILALLIMIIVGRKAKTAAGASDAE